MCAAVSFISEAEPLVCATKIIHVLVVGVRVCYFAMYIGGRAFSVSNQDYSRAGGKCVCVLLCPVYWRQSF